MKYDPKRHHRQSIRLPDYDYSQPGWYYVTIVCQEHACLLDPQPVRDMIMKWWRALPERFGNVCIDQFVIMPNHVHGIIEIMAEPTVGANPSVRPQKRTHSVGANRCVNVVLLKSARWERVVWPSTLEK